MSAEAPCCAGYENTGKVEVQFPNDLWLCRKRRRNWQSDVMHGFHVPCEGKLKKTYLIAFIDDPQLIPYGAFFFSEGIQCYLQAQAEQAVLIRGLPGKLYVENGSAFKSNHMESVTASLGIALIVMRGGVLQRILISLITSRQFPDLFYCPPGFSRKRGKPILV